MVKGLKGIEGDEWYRNIITEDIKYSADDLIQCAFEKLIGQNSGRLPVNKYLSQATGNYPACEEAARRQNFDFIISNTIRKNRGSITKLMGFRIPHIINSAHINEF